MHKELRPSNATAGVQQVDLATSTDPNGGLSNFSVRFDLC
jgi:hypothetical protein